MTEDPSDVTPRDPSPELFPQGLEAYTLALESDDFVIFALPLPELHLPEVLTDAEREVVVGVLEGKRNHEIAAERGTSPSTVVNQLAAAYKKLGVGSRWELISCVQQLSDVHGTKGETP
jgi:DNA-binding NarL/FixJ family response regulator